LLINGSDDVGTLSASTLSSRISFKRLQRLLWSVGCSAESRLATYAPLKFSESLGPVKVLFLNFELLSEIYGS